ncbi:hypothetical protein Q3G72_032825 [Acer saccharum]|nr:hypothetical protein Q3G72_032825 [Acer saccharum]
MKVIETAHQRTFDTLMSIDPERWSRCHCIGRSYNMMTTNIAESMNNCIKKARRLPITSAIEFLRGLRRRTSTRSATIITAPPGYKQHMPHLSILSPMCPSGKCLRR